MCFDNDRTMECNSHYAQFIKTTGKHEGRSELKQQQIREQSNVLKYILQFVVRACLLNKPVLNKGLVFFRAEIYT